MEPVVSFREYGEKQIPSYHIFKRLEEVLHEERHNIPLETIQNVVYSKKDTGFITGK